MEEATDIRILVADRNPHVRAFIRREMEAAGFTVLPAESSREVIHHLYARPPLHLAILDPDFPDMTPAELFEKLRHRLPPLPVILHVHLTEYDECGPGGEIIAMVEKSGSSVEELKRIVRGFAGRCSREDLPAPAEEFL